MAEFKLGRIRFVWKGNWVTGTTYYKDDIIAYGGKTFLCVQGHTAAADFYTDLDNIPSKWNQFSDGTTWQGNWTTATVYKVNDIVKYGGTIYICNEGHTAGADLETDQSKWDQFAESFNWTGAWATATDYKVNDLVKYGGYVYICNTAHASAATAALGLEQNIASWDIFSRGLDWKGSWSTTTRYKLGDIVKYGGTTYVCNLHHTSAATAALGLEADQAKWDYFNQGLEYKGVWAQATRYKVNDLVKLGAGVWICITEHTSSSTFTDAYWTQFVEGIEFENAWSSVTTYQPGDIVKYGGYAYIAKTNNTNAVPSTSTANWDLFSTGFLFQGDWSGATAYKVGEVVRHGGFTYFAVSDHTNQVPPNATYWSKLNEGIKWTGNWAVSTVYKLGDAVKFGVNSYLCINPHTSTSGDRPDLDLTGTYWNLLTGGNEESVLTTIGDLAIYGGAGATRLPIGDEGQVLTVSSDGLPAWEYFGRVAQVFYVAPHGVDSPAPTYGLTIDQPWASVRYALEQIDKGIEYSAAAEILRLNRTFIQKEIVEWTDYQIANNISPFVTGFTYDKETCQRDMGLLVDALVYDLSHTGNARTRAAAEAYFTALGVSYITGQEDETVASINYGVSLLEKVLDNAAPAANYQALNGIGAGSRIKQIFTTPGTPVADADPAFTILDGLASIVTDAITAGDLDGLPVESDPNYTLNVKTGQYYEVLPMIMPAKTAVVGDELRGTRISPAAKIIATSDKAKSVAVLQRIQSITDEIITNTAVTPTTGNTETQNTTGQKAGNTGSTTAISRVESNSDVIANILENGEGAAPAFVITDPAGYDTGYFNARRLILANKEFLKSEITAWIAVNYSSTVTSSDANDNSLNGATTSWMEVDMPIEFTGTVFGGVATGVTYYVQSIIDANSFTVATTRGAVEALTITTASGSMGVRFKYNAATCARDVGLVIDAVRYDITYGGNYQSRVAADAYFTYGVGTYGIGERTVTLAAYNYLSTIIDNIAIASAITPSVGNVLTQDTSGTAGSAGAASFAAARITDVYNTINNNGTLPTLIEPTTTGISTELLTARTALVNLRSTIQTDAVQYIKKNYPTLNFNTTTCSRDVGYIVDALGYDLIFNSNFASVKAGLAYRRGTASAQLVVAGQLQATLDIIDFIKKKASYIAASGATAVANLIWNDAIAYVNTGTEPIVVGTNRPVLDLDIINGGKILELNKEFLAAEAVAYANETFKTTVTATSAGPNYNFTCGNTSWMVAGDPIRFTGTTFGGVSTNTTYYVHTVVNSTTFRITATLGGTVFITSASSGSMTVRYNYDSTACARDTREFVSAVAYDMMHTGNFKSYFAARYYRNALTGSKLEDMFYVRNGCGLRNCTLTGLDGTSDGNTTGVTAGLSAPNEYGTRRPFAGAYVSLDPGWGPNDERAWVTNKSTYVQNVTTFGTACVGQKIDGALHNGGNDSIVSNDFTQVLSDGIGAWITNLGRAELVSVFSYYNHIGYLAENGGKIRATNGNNSYGDFGSVAEGIDVTETPVTGLVNNRNAEASVDNVIVNGDQVLLLEYFNAGSEYTEATYTISGSGANVAARGDEIRDGAVFQIRMTDPGDSSGPGGAGYKFASNQAQSGDTTSITLAASDIEGSAVYVGMSIYLTAGVGAGQYGYIHSYNAASKVAQIRKESTGTAGWDHVVPGTPIEAALSVTTTYEITPRIVLTAPPFTKTVTNLPSSQSWTDVVYGNGKGSYSTLSATGGSGSFATFNVTRLNGEYTVTLVSGGTLYTVGNNLTILGTALGGTSPANDLTITVTGVTSGSAGITTITYEGIAVLNKYVAIAANTTAASWSRDGVTWNAVTLPSARNWSAITYGVYNNVGRYVIVARDSQTSAYSLDGINWTETSIGEGGEWCDIAFGNNTFVAIARSDSALSQRAVSTNGGLTWSTGTFATGAKAITYGGTRFVVLEGDFSNSGAYSANGTTWTAFALPANDDSSESNWMDIAYGNGRYVAIADNAAMAAYSLDGATWYKSNLPAVAEWTSIRYGQGIFYATSRSDIAASSPDGVTWTLRDATYTEVDVTATAKDTNTGYVARTLPATATWTDVTRSNSRFVAVGYNSGTSTPVTAYSSNGETWTAGTISTVSGTFTYNAVGTNGSNEYVALIENSSNLAYSTDGITWTGLVAGAAVNRAWVDVAWGNGIFVAVAAGGVNPVVRSASGFSSPWTQGTLVNQEWTSVAFGNISGTNYFVTVSGISAGSNVAAYSTNNGATWINGTTLPASDFWNSVAFGNGRFVAVAGGPSNTSTRAAVSTNGTTWTSGTMPGAAARWNKVVWGGEAFTAFAYNSNRTAYSTDGITWVEGPALTATANWSAASYGNDRLVALAAGGTVANSNNFVLNTNLLTTTSGTANLNAGDRIRFVFDSAGAEIFGGVNASTIYYVQSVTNSTQFSISTTRGGSKTVLSTGSGSMLARTSKEYVASALGNHEGNPRWAVIGDSSQGVLNIRQGARARARAYVSAEEINRIWIHEPGSGYVTAPTVTITDPNNTGADATLQVRVGNGALGQPTFTNRGTNYSAASVQLTGDGYSDNYQVSSFVGFKALTDIPKSGSNVQIAGIDDVYYRLVNVTNIVPQDDGTYTAQLQISPALGVSEAPEHETAVTIRRRYSQVRLTGHDFLDIGTGNFTQTNYPGLPLQDPIPANETVDSLGGRVFYTSTDQDGNFRVGGLFNVEQSTGVATLNADAFNIAGLNELSLGSVALGGSGATINEFSTDPFFTADSDNVVPTQRAIKAYITSQIGGGGSSLNVNTLTAGVVFIAGQTIATTTNQQININTKVNFTRGVVGIPLVLNYFLLNN